MHISLGNENTFHATLQSHCKGISSSYELKNQEKHRSKFRLMDEDDRRREQQKIQQVKNAINLKNKASKYKKRIKNKSSSFKSTAELSSFDDLSFSDDIQIPDYSQSPVYSSPKRKEKSKQRSSQSIEHLQNEIQQLKKTMKSMQSQNSITSSKSMDNLLEDQINKLKQDHEKTLKRLEKVYKEKLSADQKVKHFEKVLLRNSQLDSSLSIDNLKSELDQRKKPSRYSKNKNSTIIIQENQSSSEDEKEYLPPPAYSDDSDNDVFDQGENGDESCPPPFNSADISMDVEDDIHVTAKKWRTSNNSYSHIQSSIDDESFWKSSDHIKQKVKLSPSESVNVRKSWFHMEKENDMKEKLKDEEMEKKKLARALKGTPPSRLLQREEESRLKREEKMNQKRQEQENHQKVFLAMEPPPTTYVNFEESFKQKEDLRKAKLQKRAESQLKASKLPFRMENRMKSKSSERKAKTENIVQWKPKAVPDFKRMQSRWDSALKGARMTKKSTTAVEFKLSSTEQVDKMRRKKEERQIKLEAEMKNEEERKKKLRNDLYKKIVSKHPASTEIKPTKAQQLRSETVLKNIKLKQKQEQAALIASKNREIKLQNASKTISREVKQMEAKRKAEYSGEYVELSSTAERARAKAKENKKSFQEAIKRNKERLSGAVQKRPTLLQRFVIEKKTEEGKRKALATVVANVFGSNLKKAKDILSDDEKDLVEAMATAKDETEDEDDEYKHEFD